MAQLPYTVSIRLKEFSTENLDLLVQNPCCFFFDSATGEPSQGRYSFFGVNPVKTFSSRGGFITIDNRTFIDHPIDALREFEKSAAQLPHDPYLPFSGGLVGFVGHNWALDCDNAKDNFLETPDAWFGLYDTVAVFDHLEKSCWVSSYGLTNDGSLDIDLAKERAEILIEQLSLHTKKQESGYIIKPLTPEPASNFTIDSFASAVEAAKGPIAKKDWVRANLAQRFHAPVALSGWTIHKMLRKKNPTPFSSFLRCGPFEISSISPSSFLKIKKGLLECRAIESVIARDDDPTRDRRHQLELKEKYRSLPLARSHADLLKEILVTEPKTTGAEITSDLKTHYLTATIRGEKRTDCSVTDCLKAALPGPSMTGAPKKAVNDWIQKTEPSAREIYTGAIGYIGPGGEAEFNTAVRTMVVKDQVAFVHAGCQIEATTNAEEAYLRSKSNITALFEEIRGLGFDEPLS